MHSHISPASVADHIRHYQRTNTARLAVAGLPHRGCTLMHAAAFTDTDITTFAATGVTVNYNPLGNAMVGFGLASLIVWFEHGGDQRVGLVSCCSAAAVGTGDELQQVTVRVVVQRCHALEDASFDHAVETGADRPVDRVDAAADGGAFPPQHIELCGVGAAT